MTSGALQGVRVVDLTDERAIYGAKLLADLGADVVRPEPPEGDPLRARGPYMDDAPGETGSLWHAFFASSRRFFAVDPGTEAGAAQLGLLIDRADIVLANTGAFAVEEAQLDDACARRPELVLVEVSSFGPDGPWSDYLAPDLVAGALGGAVATTGDADTPPLKAFGELNFMVSGAYAAIAALAGFNCVRRTGVGQRIHVPVHECIASALEHVFMWHWYQDQIGLANKPVLERRGSLHWTNAYQVMGADAGAVMVTPIPDLDGQLVWLLERGLGEELLDPRLQLPEHRRELLDRLMDTLREWVASEDPEALFLEAQSRHLPYGHVKRLDEVADNAHLAARGWWESYPVDDERAVRGPGAPYRFSGTPWSLGSHGDADRDTDAILDEIGWEDGR
ncbi:MAG: CoA transferase [Gammaproteobacteria bacterium]|nr:CoA transferase [Gammaproteobacteria bacterium]